MKAGVLYREDGSLYKYIGAPYCEDESEEWVSPLKSRAVRVAAAVFALAMTAIIGATTFAVFGGFPAMLAVGATAMCFSAIALAYECIANDEKLLPEVSIALLGSAALATVGGGLMFGKHVLDTAFILRP